MIIIVKTYPSLASEIRDYLPYALAFATDLSRSSAILIYPPHKLACSAISTMFKMKNLVTYYPFWKDSSFLSIESNPENSNEPMPKRRKSLEKFQTQVPDSCTTIEVKGNHFPFSLSNFITF